MVLIARVSGKSSRAKRLGKHRRVVSRFRGRRAKETEKISRVYSQRWEAKLAQHAVAHKPYTTPQPPSAESTAIYSMKYNPDRKILWLTFWKYKMKGPGSTYAYYNVPEKVWTQLNEASSKGRFFWYYIRGVYNYTRVK